MLSAIDILDIEKRENELEREYLYTDKQYASIPNVIGMEVKDAIKELKKFKVEYSGNGDIVTYQISAAVQSGNSGGPLFDKSGNVIGVVNARLMVESAAYAVKGYYLDNLCKKIGVGMSTSNTIKNLSLAEQIKKINKFIYIIEVQ